jgi:hypothetical protein
MSLALQRSANFSLVHHKRINPENIFRKPKVHSGFYIPERLSAMAGGLHHTFLTVVKSKKRVLPRFLTAFMASQPFFTHPSL